MQTAISSNKDPNALPHSVGTKVSAKYFTVNTFLTVNKCLFQCISSFTFVSFVDLNTSIELFKITINNFNCNEIDVIN